MSTGVTTVTVERGVGTATVTVSNPPVNALSDDTLIALTETATELARDDGVRAIVLTGAGRRSFFAGADLTELTAALGPDADTDLIDRHVALTGPMFAAWAWMPQPVIAAVGGHAVGGGLELALTCDLIVAEPHVRLGVPEVGLGLIPGGGGTQRLPRRVPLTVARRMVLTGELLTASVAHEAGLVDIVSAEGGALGEAQATAERLALLPARAVQAAKQALRVAQSTTLDEGLARERELFLKVVATSDAREGADAFLAKRRAAFRHR